MHAVHYSGGVPIDAATYRRYVLRVTMKEAGKAGTGGV